MRVSAQFPASPEPDGQGRTFDLEIVNGHFSTASLLISGVGISCCDSPRAGNSSNVIQPGGTATLWIARTQGNDCDGEQGTFGIFNVAFPLDTQFLNFNNEGILNLTNTPTTYQSRLSPRDPDTGRYTLTLLPLDLNQVVVNTNDSGPGSLRRAVSFGGSITFAPDLNGKTINLTSGPIIVSSDVTIDDSALSPGVSIEAAEPVNFTRSAFQFQVADGATLTTSGLSSFFTTGVDRPWSSVDVQNGNGMNFSSSDRLGFDQSSYFERTVIGPGMLEYRGTTQSELHGDELRVFLDGEELHENGLSGELNERNYQIAIPTGNHTVRWQFDTDGADTDDPPLLDEAFIYDYRFSPATIELAEALDTSDSPLNSSGDAEWSGQSVVTHEGVDAGQSGDISDSQESRLETTVNGPTLLTFWWKVSSEKDYDFLRFRIDGVEQADVQGISGDLDWEQVAIVVPAGEHTLSWIYAKDASVSRLADTAWVDQIGFDSIPEALNTPGFDWVNIGSGAEAEWIAQTDESHDGVVALQSGDLEDNELCLIETDVRGPGFLYFWWKVSSEESADYLRLSINGAESTQAPGISGEVDWVQKAVYIPPGFQTIRWRYTKNRSVSVGSDAAWLDQIFYNPLAEGLDAPDLDWTYTGDAIFYTQSGISRDGVDAARSGPLGDNQTSRIETTVTGPGQLKFWWKVSSEAPWDFLRFRIDGAETPEARGISGERAWEQKIIFVPAGTHVLSWAYSKDGSTSKGDDAGWIDKVVYTRLAEGPDVPDRDWTTSGNNNWFSQTYTSRLPGGVDAAQSGDIDDNQSSRLETTVTGPAEVRFGWKVSSEKDFDFLRFRIDGAELPGMPGISGDFYPQNFGTGWKKEIALIPAGIHTLSWTYEKDGSVSSVADTGWVDNVLITPAGFLTWQANNVAAGQDGSFDGDANLNGISNGIEYAFDGMTIEYPGPGVVTAPPEPSKPDISLRWQSSLDLRNWSLNPGVLWTPGSPPRSYGSSFVIENGFLKQVWDVQRGFSRYRAYQIDPYGSFQEK